MITKIVGLCVLSLLLSGCGGSSGVGDGGGDGGDDGGDDGGGKTVEQVQKSVSQVKIVGADGTPVTPESIEVVGVDNGQGVLSPKSDFDLSVELLPGKIYQLKVTTKDGKVFFIKYKLGEGSASKSGKVILPAIVDDAGNATKVDGLIALVAGNVFDYVAGGKYGDPIKGAKVQLSGGKATNGAYATAITDEKGAFSLIINVSKSKIAALLNSELTVQKEGYLNYTLNAQKISSGLNFLGLNLFMIPEGASADLKLDIEDETGAVVVKKGEVLFNETFEQTSLTVDDWTVISNVGVGDETNAWHKHDVGLNLFNKHCVDSYTVLAPNDNSECAVPDPIQGSISYWYGNPASSNLLNVGNFNNGVSSSGELISPMIDLTGHTGDVALRFKTWWEIESVNPNASGYDIMLISYKKENDANWTPVSRLNPLSDPSYTGSKAFIPFSNTGFNSAPIWLSQEAIPMSGLAGSKGQVKFTFDTVDSLYNTFRGWQVDNVELIAEEGTFPTLDSNGDFGGDGGSDNLGTYIYLAINPTTFTPKITPLNYDSNYNSTILEQGNNVNFTATLTSQGFSGKTASLIFKNFAGEEISEPFAATQIVDNGDVNVSGVVTIPASNGEAMLTLFVQVKDNAGTVVFELPIMYYLTEVGGANQQK